MCAYVAQDFLVIRVMLKEMSALLTPVYMEPALTEKMALIVHVTSDIQATHVGLVCPILLRTRIRNLFIVSWLDRDR